MATVVAGDYEWDADKAADNLSKHGVSFLDAIPAVEDPHAVFVDASTPEESGVAYIGLAPGGVLTVVTVERGARTRIISARRATRGEQALYWG